MKKILSKKRIIIAISILLVVLLLIPFSSSKVNQKIKQKKVGLAIVVKNLYMDKENTPEDLKLDNIFNEYIQNILHATENILPTEKKGEYYVVDLSKYMNDYAFKNITDVRMAKHNLNGETIQDVKYKDKKVYIPEKYYDKENAVPVQIEFVNRATVKELKNIEVDLTIAKTIKKTKKIYLDGKSEKVEFAIAKYGELKGYTKDDINIYANGGVTRLPNDIFEFDSKSGKVSFDYLPLYMKEIKVDINRKTGIARIANKISNVISAFAYSDSGVYNTTSSYELASPPKNVSVGDAFEFYATTYYFDSMSSNTGSGTPIGDIATGSNTSRQSADTAYNILTCQSSSFPCSSYLLYDPTDLYFSVTLPSKLTSGSKEIDFGTSRTLRMSCYHITNPAGNQSGGSRHYWAKVISYDSTNKKLSLAFVAYEDGGGSQAAWGIYSFYWKDNLGYIEIEKKYVGEDDGTSRTFKAYPAGSNGHCGSSMSSSVGTSVKDDNGKYYIGYDYDNDKGTLKYGTYCIWEDGDGDGGKLDNNYITSYSPAAVSDDGYNYAIVTISDSSDKDSNDIHYETATVKNRRRKYCYAARKTDNKNEQPLKGNFTFTSNGQTKTLSMSNEYAYFGPFNYDKVYNSSGSVIAKVAETSSSTEVDTAINKKFWTTAQETTVVTDSIKEATYNGNDSSPAWTCPTTTSSYTKFTNMPNERVYYCLKIKKKDSAGNLLGGAKFTLKNGNLSYESVETSTGRHSIFIVDNPVSYTAEETTVPKGYSKVDNFTIPTSKIIKLPKWKPGTTNEPLTEGLAYSLCVSDNTVDYAGNAVKDNATYVIEKTDYKLLLNWYKVTENGSTKADGAKFKVYKKGTTTPLKFTARVNYKDSNGDTRSCYNLADNGTITELESATIATGHKGEVCITGLDKGDYTVEETHPAKYHTFGPDNKKDFTVTNSSTAFKAMDNSNKYINLKTTFKFKKDITNTDSSQIGDTKYTITRNGVTKTMSLSEMTMEQLKLITFKVYPENSTTPLTLIKTADGVYEYDQNPDVDKSSVTTKTDELHLTGTAISNMTITIEHLPLGKYSIKEVDSSVCQIGTNAGYGNVTNPTERPSNLPNCNNSVGNSGSCIGYYTPDYSQASSHQFEITECSNDDAGSDKCSTHVHASQTLTNKPTEVTLTKKDFYHYDDAADVQDKNRDKDSKESTAEFENDKERSDFDRIDFKVKDSSGNYLNLIYVGKHGNCKTDDSYSIYRYIPGLQLPSGVSPDVFNSTIGGTTQTLHACGGHIKVINLCRGNKYTFEEIKVPDDSVYVKQGTPQVCFTIPCSEQEDTTSTSETHIINDKGTRVRFEKRDSKYNYLIPDETTTFQVYRCPKVNGVFTDCHPSDYASVDAATGKYVINQSQATAAGLKLVKFSPRKVITGDEEDSEDAAGLAGVEVYNMMSDSDVQAGKTNVVDLHPYHGILVLRYLQSGYHYVLIETVAPKNYTLPKGQDAETAFTVRNDTVDVKEVDVPNVPTSLLIKKYDNNGKLLKGAQFKIYEGLTCDPNLNAMNQPKKVLQLKTIRDGVYEARPPFDDSEYTVVQTCDDANGVCNNIPTNAQTRLTYENSIFNENINNTYVDSYADFENMVSEEGDRIEIKEGEALIQYLEYNHCYIVEEIKAPEGHSLPKHAEDRFTMVTIEENEKYYVDTGKALINKPTPFTFYKFDEYNSLLDGAEFKLQKLDDNKKYNDVTVTEIEDKGLLFYKVDGDTDNKTIRTKNGSATVYYLTPGQYRILETSPAPGKELSKNPNIATFFVDEAGNVYGNSIIINKAITEKRETITESSAEFIIGIQTGQTVIRYGIIIGVLVALITGLMILRKKSK